MARRLRLQFPGARYHVINRGNLQYSVFATPGAKNAFLRALGEAAGQFHWTVHAFVVMRNHYHLALETPEPNLSQGMHWLQSTFTTRLTRFHAQHGHVFQGRYKALLIEDEYHLARVCDYIHLNPVRAGIVPANLAGEYRGRSLSLHLRASTPDWLQAADWLRSMQLEAVPDPWPRYLLYLRTLAASRDDSRLQTGAYSKGWAIGTAGWRHALARQHAHLALAPEMTAAEITEIKRVRWRDALETALQCAGKSLAEAAGAPYPWIAKTLTMGHPAAVRGYLSQRTLQSAD